MADIRVTGQLSEFGPPGTFEDPISENGNWEKMVSARPPNIIKDGQMTNQDTDTLGYSYWTPENFDATPERPVEVWGRAEGGGGGIAGYGWRLVLAQTPGPGGGFHGYEFLRFTALDSSWFLRKYASEASFSTLAQGGVGMEAGLWLMRYDGTNIEIYLSNDGGANWTFLGGASDASYTTDLYLGYGEEDQGFGQICAWSAVGGGIEDDLPQIYRRPFG